MTFQFLPGDTVRSTVTGREFTYTGRVDFNTDELTLVHRKPQVAQIWYHKWSDQIRKLEVIATDVKSKNCSIVGIITYIDETESVLTCSTEEFHRFYTPIPPPPPPPPPTIKYLSFSLSRDGHLFEISYNTEAAARLAQTQYISAAPLGVVKATIENDKLTKLEILP